jgi:phosphate-selective porin OprO and OprP
MSPKKNLALAALAGTALVALSGPGFAQDAAQLNQMQQQIDQLQQQLKALQGQAGAQSQGQPTITAGPGPRIVQSPTNKFAIESADGQYSIALTGRLHLDVGDYVDVVPASSHSAVQDLSSGFNARRARIGVVGKVFGDWSYAFIYDAGNSNDVTPKGIQSAQVSYNGFKNTALDFGYSDTFFTLDESTSSNDIMFMERATPAVIATDFNAGDFRSNAGVRYFTDRYWLGGYLTGPAQGQSHAQTAEQFGAFARATIQPLQGRNYSLHVGGAVDDLLKAPNTGIGTANAISLTDAPELRIDSTAFFGTSLGSIANGVTGGQVYNFEVAGGVNNLFLQGEYFHYVVERQGLTTVNFDGAYAEASYTLTGESRKYIPSAGAYSGIIPDQPFSLSQRTFGAWEIAARYSYTNLDDLFTSGKVISAASQPSAVDGGRLGNVTVGLNWYVNSNMRFMLNYVHSTFDKSDSTAPLGTPIGTKFDAIALRTQVTW